MNGKKLHNMSPDARKAIRHKMNTAGIQDINRQSNHDFAKNNVTFQEACVEAGVKPTRRQAAKYRKGKGAARASILF